MSRRVLWHAIAGTCFFGVMMGSLVEGYSVATIVTGIAAVINFRLVLKLVRR